MCFLLPTSNGRIQRFPSPAPHACPQNGVGARHGHGEDAGSPHAAGNARAGAAAPPRCCPPTHRRRGEPGRGGGCAAARGRPARPRMAAVPALRDALLRVDTADLAGSVRRCRPNPCAHLVCQAWAGSSIIRDQHPPAAGWIERVFDWCVGGGGTWSLLERGHGVEWPGGTSGWCPMVGSDGCVAASAVTGARRPPTSSGTKHPPARWSTGC
jgi:hypothetical protein